MASINAVTLQENGPELTASELKSPTLTKQASKLEVSKEGRLPLLMNAAPKGAVPLLLHVEDETLDFAGDSGAIGRLNVHESSLLIDLKGKQFNAQIFPTAGSMMILGAGPNDVKVDTIMNECCKLHFVGSMFDAMSADILKGEMTGYRDSDEDGNHFRDDDSDDTSKKETGKPAKGAKKRKATSKKTGSKKSGAKKSKR